MTYIVPVATLIGLLTIAPASAQTSAPPTTGSIPTAEGSISLTEEQQLKIKQFLGKHKPAKLEQKVAIGSTLPEHIELHGLRDADTGVPAIALNYQYALAESQVLVVEPRTRRIVGIIPD
jgi:hypothetical protein